MNRPGIAICPVCGMEVEIEGIGRIFKTRHFQNTYYFCTETCLKIFKKHPEEYSKNKKKNKSGGRL